MKKCILYDFKIINLFNEAFYLLAYKTMSRWSDMLDSLSTVSLVVIFIFHILVSMMKNVGWQEVPLDPGNPD